MPVNKGRAIRTARAVGKTKNTKQPDGVMWDQESIQEFDGRANTNAGSVGREPGGRWSEAYYDRPAAIVGKIIVRKP